MIGCLDRFKSGRVALAMVAANLIGIGGLFFYYWEQRDARIEAEARAETTRQKIADWMTGELYAPTILTVSIGPTMEETRITERPVFEGLRVYEPFSAYWVVKLHSADGDSHLCTMPKSGPVWSVYRPDGATNLSGTWATYTYDDGSCFARMEPGGTYSLITIRQAETVIDGIPVTRVLPSVRSEAFTFPGGE